MMESESRTCNHCGHLVMYGVIDGAPADDIIKQFVLRKEGRPVTSNTCQCGKPLSLQTTTKANA